MSYQQTQLFKSGNPKSLRKQSGVVIVIALFIVALVAFMSTTMLARLERDTRRTTLLARNIIAEYEAQGSIAWAMDQLRTQLEQQQANKEAVDIFPLRSPIDEVEGYQVSSTIFDAQARFNINNAIDSPQEFTKLLQLTLPKLTEDQAQTLTASLVDWMRVVGQKSEDEQYYRERPIPYRAAHRAMTSASELRLVKGITPDIFEAIAPYIIALPVPTEINVQNASPQVLAILSPSMTLESGQAITAAREQNPFPSVQAFLNLEVVKNHRLSDSKRITINSHFFLVETILTMGNQRLVLYTLLEREIQQNKVKVNIIWQSKGQPG